MKKSFLLLVLTISAAYVYAQQSAETVLSQTRKVNAYFMAKYPDPTRPTHVGKYRPSSLWTRAVYYEGLMALIDIYPSEELTNYVDRWGTFHQWSPRNGGKTRDADDQCCGQTYIARFRQTGDSALIRNMMINIEGQMAENRVDYWTWIDAIQMCMPIYAQLYKMTGRRAYIDKAMEMYLWSRNNQGGGLFNKKSGLWWRDKDFVPPYKEHDGNDCYWSRGNGWVYAALVRVMNELSPKDQYYKILIKDFKAMSKALISCQRSDGFWNVSLASPATFGGEETTGTSLFLYGLSWGLRNRTLKSSVYRNAADKAWEALSCHAIHADGFLGFVQGTGKEPKDSQPVKYNTIPDFEDFGTGCFLLGATEYYKLIK